MIACSSLGKKNDQDQRFGRFPGMTVTGFPRSSKTNLLAINTLPYDGPRLAVGLEFLLNSAAANLMI
jgi:hypothetical protein